MRARYLTLPALLIVSALALAACGGSGDSADEDQISAAIQQVTKGTDPSSCKKLETQVFVEQNTQAKGKEAVKTCEENARNVKGNPKSVVVSKVEVDGSKASAEVAVTGGGFDGQSTAVSLVKEGDQWKLDKIERFAKFDKAKLIEQFKTQLDDPANEIEKSTASCFLKALEKDSQPELEELVLGGSPEPVTQLLESCS